MAHKDSNLGIIFTVVNYRTKHYLSLFDFNEKADVFKAFNPFNKWEDIHLSKDIIEKASIILVPEEVPFSGYQKLLERLSSKKKIVYLVLHKSNDENSILVSETKDMLKEKLCHPILEEHSNKGRVFETLQALGKAFQKKNISDFQKILKLFFSAFEFSQYDEAFLRLLNDYNSAEDFRLLLDKVIIQKNIPSVLKALDWNNEDLLMIIKELAEAPSVQIFDKKLVLRKTLSSIRNI